MPELIIGISLGLVILLIVIWVVSTLNSFKRMVVKIDESESGIDVALTKRYDLLTKMIDAVKGYMKHETETLTKVIEMRQPSHRAAMVEKQDFANEITNGLKSVQAIIEQYPDLKASQNVLKLQDAALEVEENLQAARRVYNSNVSYYNQKVVVFPSNVIANWKKFEKRSFFEAEPLKLQDVKINF